MERMANFLRNSFFLRRVFSSSASTANTTPLKKAKPKKKKNLFKVAQFLPNWGIGYHMAKAHWSGVSYQITKINLYKDGKHGKAWGVVHKEGLAANPFCRTLSCLVKERLTVTTLINAYGKIGDMVSTLKVKKVSFRHVYFRTHFKPIELH